MGDGKRKKEGREARERERERESSQDERGRRSGWLDVTSTVSIPNLSTITKNAPYSWGNFHACVITRFHKPQQLDRARIACSSIITCAAEPDLIGQRCCKLRLKLLLVDQLAKKTWKLIAEFVTTKRLVCKKGHSLVEPPSRVFYTVSVYACLFVGERVFQKVYGRPLPSTSPFTLFAR